MRQHGFSLVEALVALAIMGFAAVAILPAFITQLHTNTRNEERTGAITAAQQVIEGLRLQNPASLPTSGSSTPQLITVGSRQYQATVYYCTQPQFCFDGSSRHLLARIELDGDVIYEVETVFTKLD